MNEGLELHSCLYKLLLNRKSIVFERSRTGTEETALRINAQNLETRTAIPVKVKTHHSSVSKQLREEAEGSIKLGTESSLNAIISTSTLELGIDIGDLDQVIQIGGLNSSSSFLQRVGRTGRREGRPQYFRGLCADQDELVLLAGCVNLGWQRVSENILFPKRAFHILAHQIICLCLQKLGTTTEEIWKILSKAYCFSGITREQFQLLIAYMLEENFLRLIDGDILLTSNKTESEFLRANWRRLFAIFDTGPMYNVVDGKKIIGTLDSGFARAQELPFVFVLGGQEWNALKLDHEMQQVSVKKNETGLAPKWKAICNFDIPFELAQEVGRILSDDIYLEFLDPQAGLVIKAQQSSHSNLGWNKDTWILVSVPDSNRYYLWTFAGDKINRALSTLLSKKIGNSPLYNYKRLIIDYDKEKGDKSSENILSLLSVWKFETESKLEIEVLDDIRVIWFSKFSDCLPDVLAQKTICEKGIDFNGLLRELKKVKIEEIINDLEVDL